MITADDIGPSTVFAALDAEHCERLCRGGGRHQAPARRVRRARGRRAGAVRGPRGARSSRRSSSTASSASSASAHPGDIFGEVPITLGTVFPVGFRAAEKSRVMRIEAHDYHAIAAVAPEVGREVGRLAAHRIERSGAGFRASRPSRRRRGPSSSGIAGTPTCAELRRFLDRNQITFSWITPDAPDAAEQWGGPLPAEADWPAIRVVDGKTVVRPQLRRVAELLGLGHRGRRGGVRHGDRRRRARRAGRRRVRRIGGPAHDRGRARGSGRPGGHVVPDRELPRLPVRRVGRRAREPRAAAGAQARRGDPRHPRRSLRIDAATRQVHLDGGDVLRARTIILACGVAWRQLAIEGFDRLAGKGIVVRRGAQRGLEHARPRRPHRRRRQLGGPGGAVLLEPRAERDASSAAARRSRRACRAT